MKYRSLLRLIAYLRITGILSLIAFFVVLNTETIFSVDAKLTIGIAWACFIIILLLQLYRLYVLRYLKDEE